MVLVDFLIGATLPQMDSQSPDSEVDLIDGDLDRELFEHWVSLPMLVFVKGPEVGRGSSPKDWIGPTLTLDKGGETFED